MSMSGAFTPMGNTVTFTGNTAAPTAVQAQPYGSGGSQYRIVTTGNVTVFMGVGNSAATANTNAVIPAANSSPAIPLLPGTDEVLTFAPNSFFTGITISGTGNVYVTPGDGM